MDRTKYKECHRVSDADNRWLQYYDEAYIDGPPTRSDENKYVDLGYKYTDNPDWYYQWDRYEKHYYVVVD